MLTRQWYWARALNLLVEQKCCTIRFLPFSVSRSGAWDPSLHSVLNFPVAFAPNIAVHLIFRFLTGFAGSAFLSVSGGAISDVFINAKVGT